MTIESVERSLDVLELLAKQNELRFTDIQMRLGIPKSSLHVLLAVLEERGYVLRSDQTDNYRLGSRLFGLGSAYLSSLRLNEVVQGALREVVSRWGETCQFAVLDGTDVLYLFKEEPKVTLLVVGTGQGKRLPAQCTALGKAILSTMPEDRVRELFEDKPWERLTDKSVSNIDELLSELRMIRERGWSIDDEESGIGVTCVGAPVLNHEGQAIGAVSTTFIKSRYGWASIEDLGESIQECAKRISSSLGYNSS